MAADPNHYAKIIAHVHAALPKAIPVPTHLDPWGRVTAGRPLPAPFYYRQDHR